MDDYAYTMTNFKVPDLPTNLPEPTDAEYEKNVRNSCRRDAIEAIGTALDNLSQLEDGKHKEEIRSLKNLRVDLVLDMEDFCHDPDNSPWPLGSAAADVA